MIDLKQTQKEIYENKVKKGFNVTDINKEFCLAYGEMAEAYEAWRKHKSKKIIKNKHREYKIIDGVNTRVKEYNDKDTSINNPSQLKTVDDEEKR